MFKLFRDSIFCPRNIIAYRAKKWWYVLIYILILSILFGLTYMSEPMSYDPINYSNREMIIDAFDETDSKITDGVYSSNKEYIVITLSDYDIGFFNNMESLKGLKVEVPDYAVVGDSFYSVEDTQIFGVATRPLSKLEDINKEFVNVDLSTLEPTDSFFKGLEESFIQVKPLLCVQWFFMGLMFGIFTCLGYALIGYAFIMVFLRAGKFMKKSQLFKMLVFASTAMVIVECFDALLPIPTVLSWILLLLSFIPMYVLEREIMMRIRIKIMGETIMDNQSIIDKINKTLKNRDENDKSDINVDYDSDDYDDQDDEEEDN